MRWRLLMGIVVTLAVGWSVWWLVGSRMQQAALEGWLDDREAAGWQAEARSIATSGFPNRFDTRLTDLRLANPDAGWAWRTPFIDILRLSYDPYHAVVALPGGQVFAVPGARTDLDFDSLRGSLRLAPGAALSLQRLSLEARAVAWRTDPDWRGTAESIEAHVQAEGLEDGAHTYAVFVRAEAVTLPDPLRGLIDSGLSLAATVDSVLIDARIGLDRPIDRTTLEAETAPVLDSLAVTDMTLRWGDLVVALSGRVAADGDGFAMGRLDLRAENWQALLALAVEVGWLEPGLARNLEFGLALLARNRDGRSVLEVPVVFSGGLMRLGPVPVGIAPRLRAG